MRSSRVSADAAFVVPAPEPTTVWASFWYALRWSTDAGPVLGATASAAAAKSGVVEATVFASCWVLAKVPKLRAGTGVDVAAAPLACFFAAETG